MFAGSQRFTWNKFHVDHAHNRASEQKLPKHYFSLESPDILGQNLIRYH